MENIKTNKILLISVNAIGDTYLTISGSEYIKNIGAGSYVSDYVIFKESYFLFESQNYYNKLFIIKKKNIYELIKLLISLRKQKYDIVISFFPGIVNSLIFIFANAKIKLGYINYLKKPDWYNYSQKLIVKGIDDKKFIWTPEMNYLDRLKHVIEHLGISSNNLLKIKYYHPDIYLSERKDIVCHFNSTSLSRKYSTENIINLVTLLLSKLKYDIIVIDNESILCDLLPKSDKLNYLTNPSVSLLCEKIFLCKMFIGVDSFPIHIADSYNKKIIGLFGPTNPLSVFQSRSNKFILKRENINDILPLAILKLVLNIEKGL